MKFSNPRPPEGVNSGPQKPVREFFVLTGALLLVVGLFTVAVFQFGQWLAPYVPFSWERKVEARFVSALTQDHGGSGETQAALQRLSERLARVMDMPEDVSVRVHYVEADQVNAVATLGGNIIVFKGLLERLANEEALAMVLAHEIAHVKNRDVLAAMGGGVIVSIVASVVLGDAGAVADLLSHETLFAMLHFSRAKESRADQDAFDAVVSLYGHGGGAKDLFDLFAEVERETGTVRETDLMTSHPLTVGRFESLQERARANAWAVDGARTPLKGALSVR